MKCGRLHALGNKKIHPNIVRVYLMKCGRLHALGNKKIHLNIVRVYLMKCGRLHALGNKNPPAKPVVFHMRAKP